MSSSAEIKLLIEKSDHALLVAQTLLQSGYPSDAASKVYYAMFYAAQALLQSEDILMIKHSAVESALGYYFVKAGKLAQEFHKILISSRKIREIADYGIQEEIVEPVATLKVSEGMRFVDEIKRLLKEKNRLS